MRVVTLKAVAYGRRMYGSFKGCRVFLGVACDAECLRSGGDKLYAGDVFVDSDLVATGAAHGDRRMHRLALRLAFVAGNACGRIRLRVKGHRMLRGVGSASKDYYH